MVDAYKKGEMKNASSKIKKAAKGMSMDDVKDFAETKHKGLPEKVDETIIRLTESDLHRMVIESVNSVLEGIEGDDELNYDMREFIKAMQKSKGTYHAKSSDGSLQTGDKVIVHTNRRGDIEGVVEDFDTNLMTGEETVDVDYFDEEKGRKMTMICCPISRIEKI